LINIEDGAIRDTTLHLMYVDSITFEANLRDQHYDEDDEKNDDIN